MAITYATKGNFSTSSVSGTTDTKSYTMGSGTNYGAIITTLQGGGNAITGLTYNGVSCTLIKQITNATILSMFRIENPASGTNNFVASGLTSGNGIWYCVLEYSGVNQTAMTYDAGATTNSQTSGSTFTTTITVSGSNSWSVSALRNNTAFGITANSGVTVRYDEQSNTQHANGDSNATVSGTNSHVYNITGSSGTTFGIMAEIMEASGGGGSTFTPRMMTGMGS